MTEFVRASPRYHRGQSIIIQHNFADVCTLTPMHCMTEDGALSSSEDLRDFRLQLDVGTTGKEPWLHCSRVMLTYAQTLHFHTVLGHLLAKNPALTEESNV